MVRLNAYWTSVERCFANYSHLCGIVRISSPVQTILNKLIYGLDSFGPHFPRDISVAVARQSSSSPVQILAAAIHTAPAAAVDCRSHCCSLPRLRLRLHLRLHLRLPSPARRLPRSLNECLSCHRHFCRATIVVLRIHCLIMKTSEMLEMRVSYNSY